MHRVMDLPKIAQDLGRTQRLVQWNGGVSVTVAGVFCGIPKGSTDGEGPVRSSQTERP